MNAALQIIGFLVLAVVTYLALGWALKTLGRKL